MPLPARSAASGVISAAGACTITPTARWLVRTWVSGSACRITLASALTSSVDMIQVPRPSTIANCTETVASATCQTGRGSTRLGGSSTMSAAVRSRWSSAGALAAA